MGAQHQGTGLLRRELLHDARPEQARSAQLGDFHEEIHADSEEERQATGEVVDIQAFLQCGADIFAPIGQREGQFLHQRRAGFLHVVAGDGNRIEFRHFRRRIGDDVRNDPHGWFRRINIGVADHELLENVVLDGAGKQIARHALFFTRNNEIGEDRDDSAVHRHGDRDFFERDAIEEDFHVLDRVDGHARLANITHDTRMVTVIAAMGG